jgi:RimJ/RimL family protein N-acetyltransferase
MCTEQKKIYQPIIKGEMCHLRQCIPSDWEKYLYWHLNGEWLLYDAPWKMDESIHTPDGAERFKNVFIKRCNDDLVKPFKKAIIISTQNDPIGWVNRYSEDNNSTVWYIGIDICENRFLNKGIGTEALALWINYLFNESSIHKISLTTWSFNKRMIHVAEKIGMIQEGIDREMREWENNWIHRYHFGVLREEWSLKKG